MTDQDAGHVLDAVRNFDARHGIPNYREEAKRIVLGIPEPDGFKRVASKDHLLALTAWISELQAEIEEDQDAFDQRLSALQTAYDLQRRRADRLQERVWELEGKL